MPTAADGAAWWSWPIVLTGVVGLVLPSRFASIYVPIATVATLAIVLIPVVQIMRWINATKKNLTNRSNRRSSSEPKNFFRATPREGETGAAVAVVLDDGAAVAKLSAFEAHA